jgi:putative membrane protein
MMRIRILLSVAASCLLTWAVGGALAQTDASNNNMDNGTKKMMTSPDTQFEMHAAQGGLAEVKLGQLAVEKAGNPDVKAFGQKMIDDHTKANDQLKSIAEKERMTLPSTMNAKDQALYDKLSKESGAEFDKKYMSSMVKDHEEDVKEFKKEATKGKDPQLKQFAEQTTPILEGHLEMAKSTDAKVRGGS